jgi:hypothetical protein
MDRGKLRPFPLETSGFAMEVGDERGVTATAAGREKIITSDSCAGGIGYRAVVHDTAGVEHPVGMVAHIMGVSPMNLFCLTQRRRGAETDSVVDFWLSDIRSTHHGRDAHDTK